MSEAVTFAGFLVFIAVVVYGVTTPSALTQASNSLGALAGDLLGNLSASQIATYAQAAGFTGANLSIAIAIALAESSGNPSALGDTNISPGGSVGLWQINLAAHPEFAGENLNDPQTNANAAYSVWSNAGGSFSPWSTYSNGAYQAFLSQAEGAVNG